MSATGFPPVGLASIVVVCSHPLASIRRCVAALVRHTRAPRELIVIDDGSADGTGAYLAGVQDVGPMPVTIVANSRRRGRSAACRQGLEVARGDYLIVLDGDAVVTDAWLDQLIALAESDPAVGMVGCMSNDAPAPQRVGPIPYGDPDSMHRFAARRRDEYRGRWLAVEAASGPCLLIKRRALEAAGNPGTQDGPGLLDDLSRRLRESGFTARVALDLFVHRGGFGPPSLRARAVTAVERLDAADFTRRFGTPDLTRALCGYTPPADARVVLTLLVRARARRVLEIGTAFGHMTANLTEWTDDDARIFSLGIVGGMTITGTPEQGCEVPDRTEFGRLADHFGKVSKVSFIEADSRDFDFAAIAPLDFVFVDGGHDRAHVTSDTTGAYAALAPGGYLVWHDFGSALPWIEVRAAVEQLGLPDTVSHVAGTEVAFLCKGGASSCAGGEAVPAGPSRLIWEGDQRGRHSLALTNRALCLALIDRGHDLKFPYDIRTVQVR